MQLSEIDDQTSLRSAHTCKIGKVFKDRRDIISYQNLKLQLEIFRM